MAQWLVYSHTGDSLAPSKMTQLHTFHLGLKQQQLSMLHLGRGYSPSTMLLKLIELGVCHRPTYCTSGNPRELIGWLDVQTNP